MFYSLTSWFSKNHNSIQQASDIHQNFRQFYKPNSIFIPRCVSLHNTRSGYTTSTKATTHYLPNLPYVTQTQFFNTIKDLLANLDDKFKENLSDQDAKFDAKFEKQHATLLHLCPLSLHIQEDTNKFSSKIDAQGEKISSFVTSYKYRLKKISARKQFRTKIETEIFLSDNPFFTAIYLLHDIYHQRLSEYPFVAKIRYFLFYMIYIIKE